MLKFMKKIKLHHKILAALVLGVLFGAVFNVSKYKISLVHEKNGTEQSIEIERWKSFAFFTNDTILVRSFGKEDQLDIVQFFKRFPKDQRGSLILIVEIEQTINGKYLLERLRFKNIRSLEKVKTIAVQIKPIGTVFVRLLMFLAIPLVLASLIVGAASLGDIRRVGRLGGKTILWYLSTTIIAISLGLVLVNVIQPGLRISQESHEKLLAEFQTDVQTSIPSVGLVEMFVKIVPTNPFNAMSSGEMLQIIFFAVMIGVSLTLVDPAKSKPVINFFDGFSDTMIKMVGMIMKLAPFGVFALISATVGEFGFDIIQTLFWYAATLLLGLILHTVGVLGFAVKLFAGISIKKYFRGMSDPILLAFTTSSSAATLPVTMKACEENFGVPKNITSFVLPLGATINMDGTSMYQAVAAVFISQVYGLDLSLAQQLTILLTAVLASIGTAPVPGVGIVMLMIVLKSVNIPEEGIALILGVDRFLDMSRTVTNVLGDAAITTVIAHQEGVLGKHKTT